MFRIPFSEFLTVILPSIANQSSFLCTGRPLRCLSSNKTRLFGRLDDRDLGRKQANFSLEQSAYFRTVDRSLSWQLRFDINIIHQTKANEKLRMRSSSSQRRSRSSRNIDDHLTTSTSSAIGNQTNNIEEPVFYTGPPRIQLSSSPRPTTRTTRPSSTSQQTTRSIPSYGSRVHSFQLEGYTAVTTGEAPFMRVGPRPNAASYADQLDPSDPQDLLSSMGIERMMNAATSASTAQFYNGSTTGHTLMLHQQAQQQRRANTGQGGPSPLRNKIVYELECCYCQTHICGRAMRAILLADTKVELYSTDIPPCRLRLLDDDRMTQGCNCRIRDTACGTCGNVLGYHVSQPCERCLEARNNGHFWMFYSDTVVPSERADPSGNGKPLYWGALGQASDLLDVGGVSKNTKPYECFCR